MHKVKQIFKGIFLKIEIVREGSYMHGHLIFM